MTLTPRIVHSVEYTHDNSGRIEMVYNYLDYFLVSAEAFHYGDGMVYARHYLDEPGRVAIRGGDAPGPLLDYLKERYDVITAFSPATGQYAVIWSDPDA